MTQAQKDKFAKMLGISKRDQAVLDCGSDHPANCKCSMCRQWWKLMGPDNGKYGPFTKQEIEG